MSNIVIFIFPEFTLQTHSLSHEHHNALAHFIETDSNSMTSVQKKNNGGRTVAAK